MNKLLPFVIVALCSACSLTDIKHVMECTQEGETRYFSGEDGYCVKQACIDDAWTTQESCGEVSCTKELQDIDGHSVETYQCGECISGSVEYTVLDECLKRTCTNGRWSAYSAEPDVSKCGTCNDGDLRYQNQLMSEQKLICQKFKCLEGKYQIDQSFSDECQNSCNQLSNGCGECINGYVRVREDDQHKCITEICKNGVWNENNQSCNASCTSTTPEGGIQTAELTETCGECINNQFYYQNDENNICQKYSCQSGKLSLEAYECEHSCDTSKADTPDGACGVCVNGDQRCQNGTDLETCVNGQFQKMLQCPTECKQTGNKAQCQATCSNEGEKKCSNVNHIGIFSECKNGVVNDSPCLGNVLCKSNTECGECKHGETLCENSTEKRCVDGEWISNPCPNGNSCSGNQCGECKNESITYGDLPTLQCQAYKCLNGVWNAASICANNYSCTHTDNSTTTCGSCINYTFSTSEKTLFTCLNGKLESNETCKKPSFNSGERFVHLGEYIACKYSTIAGLSANSNDRIDCYNQYENGKHIGHLREDDKPCNSNTPVSCHVVGVNQTECGECLELDTRCVDATPQTCINGKWTPDLPEWHTADRCNNY